MDARIGARDGGIQAQEEADPGLLREGAEEDVHHDELDRAVSDRADEGILVSLPTQRNPLPCSALELCMTHLGGRKDSWYRVVHLVAEHFVDIKLKVPQLYKLLILKHNDY